MFDSSSSARLLEGRTYLKEELRSASTTVIMPISLALWLLQELPGYKHSEDAGNSFENSAVAVISPDVMSCSLSPPTFN